LEEQKRIKREEPHDTARWVPEARAMVPDSQIAKMDNQELAELGTELIRKGEANSLGKLLVPSTQNPTKQAKLEVVWADGRAKATFDSREVEEERRGRRRRRDRQRQRIRD